MLAMSYERINDIPDARVNGYKNENGRQNVGKKADDVDAVCYEDLRPSASEVDGGQEGD